MHQVLEHPDRHAREVGEPVLQTRVAGGGPQVAHLERLELERLFRGEVVLADQIRDAGEELLVLEHEQLGVEDARLVHAGAVLGLGPQVQQVALHVAHDALPVHREIVLLDLDRALEAAGQLDELRRGPRVHAERVDDLCLALDHGHSHPASVARASSASPSRTPVIRARNDHNSANPPAATAASATRHQPANPPLWYRATSGSAAPTTNAMAGPETAVARCSSGWRSATATRTPCVHPARSAHQRSAT